MYAASRCVARSEEHTSELQSRGHLVCRLLLEKKKPRGRDALPGRGRRDGAGAHPPRAVAVEAPAADRLEPGDGRLRFFFNDTATTEIYTLSLHDALPI